MAYFIFIESNTTGSGQLLLETAAKRHMQVLLLTANPNKYLFLPLINVQVVLLPTDDRQQLLEYLLTLTEIGGIYSSSEYFIETAAWLAQQLGLPTTNSQVIAVCRNKWLLAQKLQALSIPHPATLYLTPGMNIDNILQEATYPLIIKPQSCSGSVGVKLCENAQTVHAQIAYIRDVIKQNALVQTFITGQEFSVECCSYGQRHIIIGITKKYVSSAPFFIESGHDFPAVLDDHVVQRIHHLVTTLLNGLAYTFGFTHIELKLTPEHEIVVLEVNPRLAGGMIPVLMELATGINILDWLLDIYCGKKSLPHIAYCHYAAIRQLILQQPGIIKSITLNYPPGMMGRVMFSPGHKFIPHYDFRDRVAYVINVDDDYQRCCHNVEAALAASKILM